MSSRGKIRGDLIWDYIIKKLGWGGSTLGYFGNLKDECDATSSYRRDKRAWLQGNCYLCVGLSGGLHGFTQLDLQAARVVTARAILPLIRQPPHQRNPYLPNRRPLRRQDHRHEHPLPKPLGQPRVHLHRPLSIKFCNCRQPPSSPTAAACSTQTSTHPTNSSSFSLIC